MESLPIDVWHQIVQIGVQTKRLDHVDLCSLAMVNRHFDQLTQDPSLWATLFRRRCPRAFFQNCYYQAPSKAIFKKWHVEKRDELQIQSSKWLIDPFPYGPFPGYFYGLSGFTGHWVAHVNLGPPQYYLAQTYLIDAMEVLSPEESDPVLLHASEHSLRRDASEHSLRRARSRNYEKKPSKCFDKASRPKVIPCSKSYIPMNRPPRRSMPRKI